MRKNMSKEEKQKRIKVGEFLKQIPISSSDDLNIFLVLVYKYRHKISIIVK